MTLDEALALPSLRRAEVVAGRSGLDREVRWVHVVDNPDPVSWVREGQLVLTTGYAWPRVASEQAALIDELAGRGVTAVGLAVPQFFEAVPAVMRSEAERLGLPVVEVPWEVPFAEITQEVHNELLREQMSVLERSEAIHGALTAAAANARSLSELASELSGLAGRAVAFTGMEGEILAGAQLQGDAHERPALWEEAGFCTFARDVAERLRRRRRDQAGSLSVTLPEKLGRERCAVAPIRMHGAQSAVVWLVEGGRPLDRLDERTAEHAAIVAALHLAHQVQLASIEQRFRRSFLDSLIEGRFEPSPEAVERARLLGFDPQARYRVGLVMAFEPVPLSMSGFSRVEDVAERLRRQLVDLGAPGLLTVSLNRVAFLVPESVPPEGVWRAFAADKLACVVSSARQGVAAIRETFDELFSVAPHVSEPGLAMLDAMLLPRLLRGDEAAQKALERKYLEPLRRAKGGAPLVETLLALPLEGFHLGRVSERLGVHISTLRHRLERIESVAGIDLRDPTTRIELGILTVISNNI
ncbi:MAG: PucR family transcriptional regulator ligand-binding domain-containing protein [Deinococcales bacterium]